MMWPVGHQPNLGMGYGQVRPSYRSLLSGIPEQKERDYEVFAAAAKSGRLTAQTGLQAEAFPPPGAVSAH
jgi:hypothetical protein